LGAVVLITREKTEPGIERLSNPRGLLFALVGGAMFGLFFVFQHQTGDSAGLWPLLAARLTSVSLLALLFARRRTPLAVNRRLAGSLLFGGSLDMLANIFFLMATRHGMLAVVAALTGLYPASTVLLAQTRLNERMQRTQILGLGVAAFAAVLVAA
ncbi:MAG: DMT family transporter, partial [Aquihabitans sp.]